MSSRTDRRQNARGGKTPPKRRDPMSMVYIGLVVVIVAVFAGFGLARWHTTLAIAAASATPTPGPNAHVKPIQLVDQTTLGKSAFPIGNTLAGGVGKPIDGIPCQSMEGALLHIHAHIALFVNGRQIAIPEDVGIVPPQAPGNTTGTACLYWLHTHDAAGIIHVEAPQTSSPAGGPFTLGMFFDVWGQPLLSNQIGKFKGTVTAYVNGGKYDGELPAIPLLSHQEITLEIGKYVPPPNYTFPPED